MGIISSLIQHSLLIAQMLMNDPVTPESSHEHEILLDNVWENNLKSVEVMSRSKCCKLTMFNDLLNNMATIITSK